MHFLFFFSFQPMFLSVFINTYDSIEKCLQSEYLNVRRKWSYFVHRRTTILSSTLSNCPKLGKITCWPYCWKFLPWNYWLTGNPNRMFFVDLKRRTRGAVARTRKERNRERKSWCRTVRKDYNIIIQYHEATQKIQQDVLSISSLVFPSKFSHCFFHSLHLLIFCLFFFSYPSSFYFYWWPCFRVDN